MPCRSEAAAAAARSHHCHSASLLLLLAVGCPEKVVEAAAFDKKERLFILV